MAAPRVGLFVTCLVDLFRPAVGFSAVRLLKASGCEVVVPPAQTCCGQPAYNSGDRAGARELARQVITNCERVDYLVAPSGSCAAMIKRHYPGLFDPRAGDREYAWHRRAQDMAAKTYELLSFLTDVRPLPGAALAAADCRATYHDSCSGLRELQIKRQPRALLAAVPGLQLCEMADSEVCCGFGGTFCVKYPEISSRMLDDKIASVHASGADTLLAGDLGCLLNIAGKLRRAGSPVRVRHVAEVLSGYSGPALGEPPE